MKKVSSFISLLLLIGAFCCQFFAQSQNVKSIKILSSWDGLGTPSSSKLEIVNKKGIFYANGKKIQTQLIDEIINQFEPDKEKMNLSDFGITQEWLGENAADALPNSLKNEPENEKEFFYKYFRNIVYIEEILPKVLGGGWTDDYPRFEMEILKTDGAKIQIISNEQGIFMMPFMVNENNNEFILANPKFSKAVAAILPKKFTNRGRLNGDRLAYRISEIIYREISDKLEELETQNKIGSELAQIQNKYTLRKTAINYISSIDVGAPTNAYQTKEYKMWSFPSWNAELHRNDLPQNVLIGLSLPYKENKLVTFPIFLEKINGIVQQTLSVPWLSKYITDKPDIEFEIRFVDDRSLSPKAKESFLEDLEKFESNKLSSEVLNQLDNSVFLEISEKYPSRWSRWLILPDQRMILWQVRGESVLDWKPTDFETKNLYSTKDWFQTKAVISPNGEIMSR